MRVFIRINVLSSHRMNPPEAEFLQEDCINKTFQIRYIDNNLTLDYYGLEFKNTCSFLTLNSSWPV